MLRPRSGADAHPRDVGPPARADSLAALLGESGRRELAALLRRREGFDLDAYRSAYLARRVRSRVTSRGVRAADYPRLVAEDPVELRRLMEAVGVNVTAFFRDAAVWRFLEDEASRP